MRDEMFDRDYQAGRDALHDGLDNLFAAIGSAFRTFHDIQFRAPWRRPVAQPPSVEPSRPLVVRPWCKEFLSTSPIP